MHHFYVGTNGSVMLASGIDGSMMSVVVASAAIVVASRVDESQADHRGKPDRTNQKEQCVYVHVSYNLHVLKPENVEAADSTTPNNHTHT